MIDKHTMTIGDVAHVLGVTSDRVRQLDSSLHPVRRAGNGQRRYDPAVVERIAKERTRKHAA